MARVKRAVNAQKKRRTVLKASKGYRGQRSRLYRKAKEQQLHSLTLSNMEFVDLGSLTSDPRFSNDSMQASW